ncbi:isoprenylcysteine carboxyl methyltransferase (ICMT) family protein [Terriglobus roseus DSM 18391]|uniref:Isoprenylcysteine carboxyl methyltransferase (ICMT) family protein n=1 Tax=Terriglobus roseus (strain DSM 18391 / NRRL B-41598 / KBS 63) TaxID=926566 RepID=I3ZMV7_TERRK|nr:isoprenylcysteine carboxylmethyltransferase family protein [Terriglobus roseus]AFL90575.1 isoprenylcysteine carboxyl methyltransferase (ICMT) family protein [Terriglobus roseus DSM 18391]
MQATAFEYKHRYLVHGLIYTLCFAAPWPDYHNGAAGMTHIQVWNFVRNGSVWFRLSDALTRPLYQHFASAWNTILVGMILFALAGAALRVWGAAYLGATTVQRGGMVGDRIVADGPYRFVRNPLYLGTILHTIALAMLMRPDAAVLCVLLITLVQLRLIGREEPYLRERLGESYSAYLMEVPRLVPSLRPCTAPGQSHPHWQQGILSEIYIIGVAVTLAAVGWSNGFAWEASVLRVMQGIVISLGLSVMARAFIPKATF